MKYLKYIFASLIIFFSITTTGFCQIFSFEKNPYENSVVLPAGTLFRGILKTELSSEKNVVGDPVYVVLPFNIKMGKYTCIPKQTLLVGEVIQVQKAQKGRNGLLQIKFDGIRFPDGTGSQLSAHIWNRDNKGIIGGEVTNRTSYKKMPHYIEDVGTIAQVIETGERAMGKEKRIPSGIECIIVLDNDLEVKYWEK